MWDRTKCRALSGAFGCIVQIFSLIVYLIFSLSKVPATQKDRKELMVDNCQTAKLNKLVLGNAMQDTRAPPCLVSVQKLTTEAKTRPKNTENVKYLRKIGYYDEAKSHFPDQT